ncbi:hypothetical protein CesoFtcFv8_013736 [Champsocephalus esox]|uniref:Uncharacterized protein n=1 Tax=Champsocephalus esox TaxID=159716 RepID=A0AAN8BS85_9TELE|nr:hypothetical protein CesoFtcFv8_013736 [Champsocephalus esox]
MTKPLVSWANPYKGKPVTKQRLSHWFVEAIALGPIRVRVRRHPRVRELFRLRVWLHPGLCPGCLPSKTLVQAASWSSPLTFVRLLTVWTFYSQCDSSSGGHLVESELYLLKFWLVWRFRDKLVWQYGSYNFS